MICCSKDHKFEALVIPLVGGVRLVNGGSREVGGCVGVSDGPVVVLRSTCKRNITGHLNTSRIVPDKEY